MTERRFSSRTLENISCSVQYNNATYNCNIIDISREGMALCSYDLCPTVDEIVIILFKDKHENKFYGTIGCDIKLVAKVENVTIKNSMYRIGVHISDEEFIKYIDKKQAHLWFKRTMDRQYK